MSNTHGQQVSRPSRSPDAPVEGYHQLVAAIIGRAVQDAVGRCDCPRGVSVAQLQHEARAWLADEEALRTLLELTGHEAGLVLHRVRQVLHRTGPPQQLALFGADTGR